MDEPLVCQLFCQEHGWLATFGRDNRWKHLSGKLPSKPGFPIRAVEDHHVDRSDVEAQQCVELTDTNRSRACFHNLSNFLLTFLKEVLASSMKFSSYNRSRLEKLNSVTVIMARGKRPAPFRTWKLSLSAPMVLLGGPSGRVGRCRTYKNIHLF